MPPASTEVTNTNNEVPNIRPYIVRGTSTIIVVANTLVSGGVTLVNSHIISMPNVDNTVAKSNAVSATWSLPRRRHSLRGRNAAVSLASSANLRRAPGTRPLAQSVGCIAGNPTKIEGATKTSSISVPPHRNCTRGGSQAIGGHSSYATDGIRPYSYSAGNCLPCPGSSNRWKYCNNESQYQVLN